MGFFKVHDRVTGAVYRRSDWRIQRQSRDLYAEFYTGGPFILPEWPGIEDYGRNLIALFLADWGSESYLQVNQQMPELLDVLFTMDAGDIHLLVRDVALDGRSRKHPLPEPAALSAAMKEVPLDPDSEERHRWRFGLRRRELQASLERVQAKAKAPWDFHYTDAVRAEVTEELAAGYCGWPDCQFCEEPG
jgi:hypothetical protein